MEYVNNRRNHAPLHSVVLTDMGDSELLYHPNFIRRIYYRLWYLAGNYAEITVEATNRMPYQLTDNNRGIFKGWTDKETFNSNASIYRFYFFRIYKSQRIY